MTWKEKPWAGECTQNVPVTYNPLPQAQCWNKWPYSIYPEKWHFKCMTQRGEDCSVAEIKHLQGQHSSFLLQRSRAAINFRGSSGFFEPGATCNWCQRSHRTVLVEICGVLEYFPHLVWLNFPKSFYNQSSVCYGLPKIIFFSVLMQIIQIRDWTNLTPSPLVAGSRGCSTAAKSPWLVLRVIGGAVWNPLAISTRELFLLSIWTHLHLSSNS